MALLTDRTALVTPADGDFYVTTDISDTTDAATGTDKKITFANLKTGIGAGLITQTISNGVTTTAPSEDVVFDALALKAPLISPAFTTPSLGVATATTINGATITSGTLNGSVTGTNTGDQTVTNSSDATSHTVTLSASGGSVQLIEGTNITLTTGGTGSAGTVTITASGGSGDVTKVGTPVNNQVGVWTGDGTLEGDAALTFDTATDVLSVGGTIELGHASDTTLARSGAGAISVEGVGVALNSTSLTHTAATIELGAASDTTLSRSAAGVLAVEGVVIPSISSTSTFTNKSIGAGALTLEENASIALDPAGSADGKYTGITVTGTAGATLAFGDLIYLDPTDSRWELADANAAAAADGDARGILGICVLAAAGDASATTILLQGIVRADTAFPALTIGAPVYVSETAGDIVVTQPTTTDVVIRIVGVAITADEIFFRPDFTWTTHT